MGNSFCGLESLPLYSEWIKRDGSDAGTMYRVISKRGDELVALLLYPVTSSKKYIVVDIFDLQIRFYPKDPAFYTKLGTVLDHSTSKG